MMLAYNRRITRLVWLIVGTIVMISVMAGLIGAVSRSKPVEPAMRRSHLRFSQSRTATAEQAPELTLPGEDPFELLAKANGDVASLLEGGGVKKKRDPLDDLLKFDGLHFILLALSVDEGYMDYLRSFVGGLHRMAAPVPTIHVFHAAPVDARFTEEISSWSGVRLEDLQAALAVPVLPEDYQPDDLPKYALLDRIATDHGHAIFIRDGFEFDPAHQSLVQAEQSGSPERIQAANDLARKYVMGMARSMEGRGYVQVTHNGRIYAEGYMRGNVVLKTRLACLLGRPECRELQELKTFGMGEVGLSQHNAKSELSCHVRVKGDPIQNFVLATSATAPPPPANTTVAVGLRVSSDGLASDQEPAFLQALPTLLSTATGPLTVYLAYDHGDLLFEDASYRQAVTDRLKAARLVFLQLPKVRHESLSRSMVFAKAVSDGHQYYFQAADDLLMETAGWDVRMRQALAEADVVAVADEACEAVSYFMVPSTHYSIFGSLYPAELKDWRIDRWMGQVYGDRTVCLPDVVAKGGPLRAASCSNHAWRAVLEAGQFRVQQWRKNHPPTA